jgi:signal peptidase I
VLITFLPAQALAQVSLTYGLGHRVMRAYHVPTGAMAPTIEPGDRILADRVTPVQRWDVIVFQAPHEPGTMYVKRLVGLPGETVEIVEEGIEINGSLIPKPAHLAWLRHDGTMKLAGAPGHGCTGSPISLGPDEYYVLGDNTRQSLDSRLWGNPQEPGPQPGAVPGRYIQGIVRMIYAPMKRARTLDR